MVRPPGTRSGTTLVELLAALSVVGTVLVVLSGLLSLTLRAEGDGRRQLIQSLTLGRLARQFRQDVHAAANVDIPASDQRDETDDVLIALTHGDGGLVRYQRHAASLVREQFAGGELKRREVYRFPAGNLLLEAEDGPPRLVSLLVDYGNQAAESGQPRLLRIDARLGVRQSGQRSKVEAASP